MQNNNDRSAPIARRVPTPPLGHWRERYREAGLSVILALQAAIIFVVSPLASVGWIRIDAIEILRFGLAATAILIVNRNRAIGACVAATFVASLAS